MPLNPHSLTHVQAGKRPLLSVVFSVVLRIFGLKSIHFHLVPWHFFQKILFFYFYIFVYEFFTLILNRRNCKLCLFNYFVCLIVLIGICLGEGINFNPFDKRDALFWDSTNLDRLKELILFDILASFVLEALKNEILFFCGFWYVERILFQFSVYRTMNHIVTLTVVFYKHN